MLHLATLDDKDVSSFQPSRDIEFGEQRTQMSVEKLTW